ncbi:hypothetical protein N7504_000152 [Penicillium tannophilum]|nr:hypothetical protein N7504_000152 [Penicillium tannophilum]
MSGKFSVTARGRGGVPLSDPSKRPGATEFDKVAALGMAEELKALGAQLIKAGLALIKIGDEATAKAEADNPAAKPRLRRHGRGRGGRGEGKKARKSDAAEMSSASVADDVAQEAVLAYPASAVTQGTIGADHGERGTSEDPWKQAQRRPRHRGGRRRRRRQADAGTGGGEEATSSPSEASPMHPEGATSTSMDISLAEEVFAALTVPMSQAAIAGPLLSSQEDWLIEFPESE